VSALLLAFSPAPPLILIAALALGAIALALLALRTRAPLGLWRLPALGLVLLALGDPSLLREKREPQKTIVPVVLDRSGSQTLNRRAAQTDAARAALEAALARFPEVEPRFLSVGDGPGANDGTRLFSALSEGLKDVPRDRIGAAILVTDGVVHDIPASSEALGFSAPLHALITGYPKERDRRIDFVSAPRFGIVGKELTLQVRVLDTQFGPEPIAIDVRRDGETIARRMASPGEIVDVPLPIPHGGPNVVEVETPALPDELTAINNKAVLVVEGVRDRLKVLLVSGEPHPGERSWRNLLRADANVELVHFTILRPPEKLDGTPASELSLIAFPTADLFGRKIKDFDLIVFDRYSNQTLLPSVYFDNIANFVKNGGAFLAAVGPDYAGAAGLYYSPLEDLLPARPNGALIEEAFRAHLTKDGEKHPVTRGLEGARANPPQWGEWFREVETTAIKGQSILAGARDKPLLVLSREGKGRIGMLLTDQLWLWARGYEGGGPHADLMRRLAHWLMKEPDLEEEALRARAQGRDITIERQSVSEEGGVVAATAPSGAHEDITLGAAEPGLWRAHLKAKELGLYRFESGGLTALVNVGPQNALEFREVISTPEQLRPLATQSGGGVHRLSRDASSAVELPRIAMMDAANTYAGADWIGIKRSSASALLGVDATPLALGPYAMLALLALTVFAWAREGRR
jgi:hypothetical protein